MDIIRTNFGYNFSFKTNIDSITFKLVLEYYQSENIVNVVLTSGRKRKMLNMFEENTSHNNVGIKGLIWALNTILNIEEHINRHIYEDYTIAVGWLDSKRKRVYSRLVKYGYRLSRVQGSLHYTKQIKVDKR